MIEAEPSVRFQFRRPWLADERWISTATVTLVPRGYGSPLTLEDGPFDLAQPAWLDAYAECLSGWGESLTQLRALIDFSVDLRRYR